MLRPLVAIGLLVDVGPSLYCANGVTTSLADPSMVAGYELNFGNSLGPCSTMTEMLSYSQSVGYYTSR